MEEPTTNEKMSTRDIILLCVLLIVSPPLFYGAICEILSKYG